MAKEIRLKTKRLFISPSTDGEIKKLIENTADPALKTAYGEMLSGCEKDSANRLWYAPWKLCLKSDPGRTIGNICFMGPQVRGCVEVGYGIDPEFEGNGYMTEALTAITDWAFAQTDVYTIFAETAPDNSASQRVLEKLEFVPCGSGEEGPRYKKEKPATSYLSVYMCLGMCVGMSIGSASDRLSVGMCLGMSIGMMIGVLIDHTEAKHRKEVTGEDPDSEKE